MSAFWTRREGRFSWKRDRGCRATTTAVAIWEWIDALLIAICLSPGARVEARTRVPAARLPAFSVEQLEEEQEDVEDV
jgi:hypothetical protein